MSASVCQHATKISAVKQRTPQGREKKGFSVGSALFRKHNDDSPSFRKTDPQSTIPDLGYRFSGMLGSNHMPSFIRALSPRHNGHNLASSCALFKSIKQIPQYKMSYTSDILEEINLHSEVTKKMTMM